MNINSGRRTGKSVCAVRAPSGVRNLHNTLTAQGVFAATVAVNAMITSDAPEGIPAIAPDDLARTYWNLHTRRDRPEIVLPA